MIGRLTGWVDAEPRWIQLMWAVIVLAVILVVFEQRARNALGGLLSSVMQRRLAAQASVERTYLRLGCVISSLIAAVFALRQPQMPGTFETVATSTTSADVMFVLDTSRSMLAEDAAPNRLARAKAEIAQMVTRLDDQRVGLVVFAGRAVQACPLTPDHGFFSTVLGTIDTRSAGRGGSRVGEAIKAALRGFPQGPGAKLIVLITDGDDQDKHTQEAATLARNAGVKIVAIGLGSEEGSEITLTDPQTGAKTRLMHDGAPVISKLDGAALRKIALVTEGAYVPAGTNAVDLDAIVESHVAPIVRSANDVTLQRIAAERFQWLVLVSLLFLFAALWVGATAVDQRSS